MTDEQINAAIADACGWRDLTIEGASGFYKGFDNGAELRPDLPDYVNDLNAMHEAEKVLTGLNRHAYCDALLDAVPDSPDHLWEVLTATARQRAAAFLRTLDK